MPATEFIVNPVQSLFSSFVGHDVRGQPQVSCGYDSFASSDCRTLSACDLNMIIQHDEDDIKQARMLT